MNKSTLKTFYNIVNPEIPLKTNQESFDKYMNFIGVLAEVESFSGEKTSNEKSSASGIFHYLVNNGGGYNKKGQKVSGGNYTKKGGKASSSFNTAKTRLRNLIRYKNAHDSIISSGIMPKIEKVLKAKTPDELTNEEQALLAYADLKMKGSNLTKFLDGEINGVDLYMNDWVTLGSKNHSKEGIVENWNNAVTRVNKKNRNPYTFFGVPKSDPNTGENNTNWWENPFFNNNKNNSEPSSDSEELIMDKDIRNQSDKNVRFNGPETITGERLYRKGGMLIKESDTITKEQALISIKNKKTLI